MTLANEILGFSAEIVEHLRQRGETISTAESLTAGSVSAAIVMVAGASDVFVGGMTAYRDEIKVSHLDVDPELIEKHTVISEEVAVAMAKGAIKSLELRGRLEQQELQAPTRWAVLWQVWCG
jgi:nicotinamide-nucleotide amidase